MRIVLALTAGLALLAWVAGASAEEERSFRLAVAAELEASGLTAYLLPRFSLKTGRRVELVTAGADLRIDTDARPGAVPLMARGESVFVLTLETGNPAAAMFADWIGSEIGQTAIAAFRPEDGPAYTAVPQVEAAAEIEFTGDAELGARLAEAHCGRCHRVRADRSGFGIGSTPSFRALRALDDWAERFLAFYALNPHPSFMRLAGISPPFDPARPPPIVPIELTVADAEAIRAYAAGLEPADLGAPVAHQ